MAGLIDRVWKTLNFFLLLAVFLAKNTLFLQHNWHTICKSVDENALSTQNILTKHTKFHSCWNVIRNEQLHIFRVFVFGMAIRSHHETESEISLITLENCFTAFELNYILNSITLLFVWWRYIHSKIETQQIILEIFITHCATEFLLYSAWNFFDR